MGEAEIQFRHSIDYENEPLCNALEDTHISGQIKIPKREYDETRDPKDYLVHFTTKLKIHRA